MILALSDRNGQTWAALYDRARGLLGERDVTWRTNEHQSVAASLLALLDAHLPAHKVPARIAVSFHETGLTSARVLAALANSLGVTWRCGIVLAEPNESVETAAELAKLATGWPPERFHKAITPRYETPSR